MLPILETRAPGGSMRVKGGTPSTRIWEVGCRRVKPPPVGLAEAKIYGRAFPDLITRIAFWSWMS